MNILWFNWRDIRNPDAGGAEVFTHQVAKRLVKMGFEVTLFTSAFEGCRSEEEIDNVKIVRRGGKYSVYREAKAYCMKKRGEFDLLIDEINTRPFLTPTYADSTPVIGLIHQLAREFWFYETSFPLNLIGYYFLEKHWLKKYLDLPMITVSRSTKRDLDEMGFRKVHIVPEGLDVEPLTSPREKEGKPTLLFVGRFKKAKKPDDAIKAFKIVKREVPDAQLWMVGDGYMMPELRKMAHDESDDMNNVSTIDDNNSDKDKQNDSEDSITFFGRIGNEKKLDLIARAHFLLVPGVREGWGLVVTEANAMGTPAVAYDVHGLCDSVVDKVTGVLVEPGDYVAMAIAAVDLLNDREKLTFYSRNAIKWARKFSWDKTAHEFAGVIEHYAHRGFSHKLMAERA